MRDSTTDILVFSVIWIVGIAMILGLVGGGFYAFPKYRVWANDLRGQATLKEAAWDRRVAIEEAEARAESAQHDAKAEVIRAGGVAEANKIIGDSLRQNEAYLRYLWINGLHDGSSEIIYVPTEANLPILEATRGIVAAPVPK